MPARQPGRTHRAAVRHAIYDFDDEPGSYYPLIAESARYADDIPGWRSLLIRAPVFMMVLPYCPRCRVYFSKIYD